MRDAFVKRLIDLARCDERLMLVSGDLGFKVLDEFRAAFPRQFLNAGVAAPLYHMLDKLKVTE